MNRKQVATRLLLTAGRVALLLTLAANAAPAIELCAVVDGSGSIGSNDFTLQLQGLADAVGDPTIVPRDGSVTLSVVQFGSIAVLAIAPTLIDSAATATSLASAIGSIAKDDGSTNMAAAIDLCRTQGLPFASGQKQVIDMSTDGMPDSAAATFVAVDAAVAAGVEAINALGVGSGVDAAFLNSMVRPQPAKAPPQDGFVLLIPDFNAYADAIAAKLRAEISGTGVSVNAPVASLPALAMLAMLLLAAGALQRPRRPSISSKPGR